MVCQPNHYSQKMLEDVSDQQFVSLPNRSSSPVKWMVLGLGFLPFLGLIFSFFLWAIVFSLACLPCAFQLFRLAKFYIFPFSHQEMMERQSTAQNISSYYRRVDDESVNRIRKLIFKRDKSTLLMWLVNIVWMTMFGWWICLIHLLCAGVLFLTIVGKSYAKRHLVLLETSLFPFGVFIRY